MKNPGISGAAGAQAQQTGTATKTLPARLYVDPAQYARERDGIFASDWLLFGHTAMWPQPGAYVAQTIAGWPVMVMRGRDGALKAYHNVCRHRAAALLPDGTGKADMLRCPYHGWVYDTDGQLRKAPDFGEDDALQCNDIKLFSINLEIWNNLVFICLAPQPPDFGQALGDLPAVAADAGWGGFAYHSFVTHDISCNWKVYAENYAEGYHIPAAHPALSREVDMRTYRVVTGDKTARHVSTPRAESAAAAINDGLWVWFWPHAALNVYRGGMNLELMVPTGPESVRLYYYYLFAPETDADAVARTIAMSRQTTAEDVTLCEMVQKNLRAGIYETGFLSPRHEQGVAYFQSLIRALGCDGQDEKGGT